MSADLPVPPDDIESLIQRSLRGDQAAWERIVRQPWRKVYNVAYKFVGRHDQAEDLTQDIFLKIFKSLNTFDRRANFQTWLISVSRNLCIDHYRMRAQRARNHRPRARLARNGVCSTSMICRRLRRHGIP